MSVFDKEAKNLHGEIHRAETLFARDACVFRPFVDISPPKPQFKRDFSQHGSLGKV